MNSAYTSTTRSRLRRSLLLGSLAVITTGVVVVAPYVWARPVKQTKNDERIAFIVSSEMINKHLSKRRLDDEVSKRAFEMFLKRLDAMKLFFLQSDIDNFSSEKLSLDDKVKRGDVSFAKRVYDVFIKRAEERVAAAQRFLDMEHDFTVDEEMVRDPDVATYAKSIEEADDRWRRKVKRDLLLEIGDDEVEYAEAVEKMRKRYRNILRRTEQMDNDELLEIFLSALTMSFDPHSSYMAPSTLQNFTIQMSLELNGIGASLLSEYGETTVKQLVPGGAAEKDGRLKIDDVITGVAQGMEGEFVDIVDMKINDVVQLIRGKPGTIVRLEVNPADNSGRKVYDITRARIELKDREARSEVVKLKADGTPVEATESDVQETTGQVVEQKNAEGEVARKIGVISLPSFYMDMKGRRAGDPNYKSTARDVRRLLEDFNREEVDLVIMDLRFNGGGSLPESVEVTGLFIDQGPVVQVKGNDGRVTPYRDEQPGAVCNKPLIVVINKFSASASEIFAGAIQDYGRGIVVGDKTTHGKGTVQQLKDLGQELFPFRNTNLGALKLTIQQFYRPSGDSTQNRGVVSDIELPYITTHMDVGESDLDYAVAFDRIMPMQHANYRNATADIISQLQERSKARRADSEYFSEEQRKIDRYLEQKEDATVTLNKEKFLAERAEADSQKDQEKIFEDMMEDDKPVFPTSPSEYPGSKYNDEIVAIALDYLELLNSANVAAVQNQK